MKRLPEVVTSIRQFCEIAAVALYSIYWPIANIYWIACGALGFLGKSVIGIDNSVGGALGAVSFLMAFLVPLWAIAIIGTYYLAFTVALASLRPIPILLCTVAWLERANLTPNGHIQLSEVAEMYDGKFSLLYPLLFSALPLLASVLVIVQGWREAKGNVR